MSDKDNLYNSTPYKLEFKSEENSSNSDNEQKPSKRNWNVFNSLTHLSYIMLNILSLNYLNGIIMLLYKYYCQREHFSVREKLEDIVKEQGYVLETYELPTNDDYMLVLHRIRGKSGENPPIQYPVFLQHGLLCSSADFLLEDCMAYEFANSGRDVWLGNFRGNIFSRRYPSRKQSVVEQRVNNKNFWHFSFDEHGKNTLKVSNEQSAKNFVNRTIFFKYIRSISFQVIRTFQKC